MHPIKIIFFDIDGTLVDPATGRISEKTAERNSAVCCHRSPPCQFA